MIASAAAADRLVRDGVGGGRAKRRPAPPPPPPPSPVARPSSARRSVSPVFASSGPLLLSLWAVPFQALAV